jgi:hypothetical protein
MTTPIDSRTILVVSAIRQSIEMGAGPGLSVNRHANHFMVNVIGEIDLLKAAELVLKRLDEAAGLNIVK